MADMMDYLNWRGDLSFDVSPFNEVDNLILSQLAYVNFDGIVPGIAYDESVTLTDACELFFKIHSEKKVLNNKSFIRLAPMVMKKMAETIRFKDVRLCKYVNNIDYTLEKQFSALHIILDQHTLYVAFRGTDDTLVGWKEDFNMSFMTTIPAQLEAVTYLNHTVLTTPYDLIIGGHSKGGNLAIYASVNCKSTIKERIITVYNNDGPGFNELMIASLSYQEMLPKIRTIIPQSSIVGMLLEHEEEYTIVKSKQTGIMQHDAMSWEILGTHFVYTDNVSKGSKILDTTLKAWLSNLNETQRAEFVDAFFSLLDATGAKTLSDLTGSKLGHINQIIKTFNALDDTTKEMLGKVIKALTIAYYTSFKQSLSQKSESDKIQ